MADTVWLDVLPSLTTFAKDLVAGTTSAADGAGKQSGASWSKAFSATASDGGAQKIVDGLKKASSDAEKAVSQETQAIAKSRAAQRDAAARVVEAEAKLSAARDGNDAAKVEAAELRLEGARERLNGATAKVEQNEKSLAAASRARKEAAEQLAAAEKDLGNETEQAGEQGKKSGSAFDRLKDSLLGTEGGAGRAVTAIGGVVAAVGLAKAAAETLKDSWAQATEAVASQNLTQASLGLTDEQASAAGKAAGQLYAQMWGESVADTNSAVASVMSSISGMRDASSADIQAVTEQAMGMSRAFDVDVSEAARNAGIWINTGLAGSATEAFDVMAAGLQQIPEALRGEVLDATHEYAQFFSQLGLDGSQAMKLLVDASANGQYGIDKMGDALKELTIRSSDMSTKSVAAYEAAGLSAEDMSARFLAGGDEASGALSDLISGLQGIDDPVAQANAAIALFGTPLEDLGTDQIPAFLDSLSGVGDGMGDVSGTAQGVSDKLTEVVDPVESLKRSLTTAISEGLEPFVEPATKISDWAKENPGLVAGVIAVLGGLAGAIMAVSVAQTVATTATTIATAAQKLYNLALKDNPIGWVIIAITALVAGFVWLWNNVEPFRNFWIGLWEGIKSAAATVADWFTGTVVPAFQAVWDGILQGLDWLWHSVFEPIWDGIKTAVAIAVTAVVVIFEFWKTVLETVLAPIFDWLWHSVIEPVWNGIQTAINAVVDWFQNTAYPIFQTVVTAISDAFAWVRDRIGEAWAWIRDMIIQPVIDWLVGVVVMTFNTWRDIIVGVFNSVRDGIGAAWDWIRNNIIQPVVDWFNSTIVPAFTSIKDNIVGAFEAVRDGISNAWNAIKELAAEPVRFVVNTVIAPMVETFNTVGTKFGIDAIPVPHVNFADGGFSRDAQIGTAPILWAEAGPEAYIPLSPSKRTRSVEIWAQTGQILGVLPMADGGIWPVAGSVSSGYGNRVGPFFGAEFHDGIDIAAALGTEVRAALAGIVNFAGVNGGYGNMVRVDHGGGLQTFYAHLSQILTQVGAMVEAGSLIGLVGSTGASTGPHLHFGASLNGASVDPSTVVSGDAIGGAFGGLGIDLFGKIGEWVNSLAEGIGSSPWAQVVGGMGRALLDGLKAWVTDKIGSAFSMFSGSSANADGSVVAMAQQLAAQRGWTGEQWSALDWIVQHESSWNPTAQNPTSTAYGLFQFLDSTWATVGASKTSDPSAQIQAGLAYIAQRYGNPLNAQAFWQANGWYDNGGLLDPGMTVAINGTGKTEKVLTDEQWATMARLAASATTSQIDEDELARLIAEAVKSALAGSQPTTETIQVVMDSKVVAEAVRKHNRSTGK